MGEWQVGETTDRLTGVQTTYVFLQAVWSSLESPYNATEVSLLMRCNPQLEIIVWWAGKYMAANVRSDIFPASYSVDGGSIRRGRWTESNNNEGTFIGNEAEFLNNIRGGDRLVVRVVAYDDVSYTAEFALTGIEQALTELTCVRS